ncbi:MAG: RNA polymerase sigma-70 factor [Solitalea sp.]
MPTDKLILLHESLFRTIYNQYKDRLYGYILAIVHSEEVAEDISYDLFSELWARRQSLRDIRNMEHYLVKVARNKSLNYLRKAKTDARIMERLKEAMRPSYNAVEEHITMLEYTDILQKAVEQLSPRRKQVFYLSRERGMTLDEIACEMNLSRNTVKNHLVEALRFIRSYFEKHGITSFSLLFITFY